MLSATTSTTVPGQTLDTPDGTLYYEVRGTGPLVVLVGAPMDAQSFAPLADLLATDHTVLTTDPRGINRSPLTEPNQDSTPEQRADDLARLVKHLDAGPAIVLGSSGGAVTALAFAQAYPELASTVISHEPPLERLLDDADEQLAQAEDLIATYLSGDRIGAWKKFFAQANIFMPEGAVEEWFGGEQEPQAAADERFWFEHELRASVSWQPDLDKLRTGGVRIVVGIGEESGGQLCERTSATLAAALGVEPDLFPGDHTGFVDQPEPFATRLRAVLGRG